MWPSIPMSGSVEEEALEPVIRKDSLKAWKLEQERLKKEETTKKSKENMPKGNQQKEEVQVSDMKEKALSGDKRSRSDKGDQTSEKEAEAQRRLWQTTTSSGGRICTIGAKHRELPTPSIGTFKATDPITHQAIY
ncbi:hypothetical protein GOODEAATRI_005640 [Goodea atripinnis]|uniref:Uncharacterized protein n=1 Tax=Goodea atripinnis TaxID=208336 RepID=A0ABV0MZU3_9TELE